MNADIISVILEKGIIALVIVLLIIIFTKNKLIDIYKMLSLIWSDTIGKLWRRITRYNRCKKALLEMPYDERVDFCGKNYLPHNKRFRELDKAYNDIKNDECLVLNQLLKKGLVIVKNKKDGEMLAFWYDQYIYYFDFIDNKRKTKGSK